MCLKRVTSFLVVNGRGRAASPWLQMRCRTSLSHGCVLNSFRSRSLFHSSFTRSSFGCMASLFIARMSPFSQSGTAPIAHQYLVVPGPRPSCLVSFRSG